MILSKLCRLLGHRLATKHPLLPSLYNILALQAQVLKQQTIYLQGQKLAAVLQKNDCKHAAVEQKQGKKQRNNDF